MANHVTRIIVEISHENFAVTSNLVSAIKSAADRSRSKLKLGQYHVSARQAAGSAALALDLIDALAQEAADLSDDAVDRHENRNNH